MGGGGGKRDAVMQRPETQALREVFCPLHCARVFQSIHLLGLCLVAGMDSYWAQNQVLAQRLLRPGTNVLFTAVSPSCRMVTGTQ